MLQSETEGLETMQARAYLIGTSLFLLLTGSVIGVDAVIAEARRVAGEGPTKISFDVDGLDPVYAPGTCTPEIGGIFTLDALRLLRGLRGINLVGGDVVEVAPPFDQTGNTSWSVQH